MLKKCEDQQGQQEHTGRVPGKRLVLRSRKPAFGAFEASSEASGSKDDDAEMEDIEEDGNRDNDVLNNVRGRKRGSKKRAGQQRDFKRHAQEASTPTAYSSPN